ncbi:MAG: hypothetical protein BRC26_01365 [Nanohaloarchaea archaeon QH_8_44_6]|nr:MAG: hypothetical protein BRC26_01365 [Nanohaloarchaea archaeon QH_8_44_6]
MVLNLLAGFIYDVVQQSWMVSSVLIKYLLVFHIAKAFYDGKHNMKHLEEVILRYSRPTVFIIVMLALISVSLGLEVEPRFKLFSQLIALLYFAVLFWKF